MLKDLRLLVVRKVINDCVFVLDFGKLVETRVK